MELAGAASSANDTARPAQYVSFLLARPGSGCVSSSFQIAHSPFHKGWATVQEGKTEWTAEIATGNTTTGLIA